MWTRRQFAAAGLALGTGCARPTRTPPNVLVFLSDQESQRVDRKLLQLPNRERLEAHGTTFSRAWCATPQCSPARAALWTGRWPHRAGVVTNIGAVGSAELSPEIPGIGRLFQDAGYRTGYFGKWHLTAGREIDGDAFGFDVAEGRAGGDRGAAARAAEWIESQERQGPGPWLAIVSLLQPHDIYLYPGDAEKQAEAAMPIRAGIAPPASDASDLASRPAPQQRFNDEDQGVATAGYDAEEWRRYRSYYYELIEDVDRNLGVVLDAVGDTDTIIAYSSDHGDMTGSHGLSFKGPFPYEELLNIPLTIAWPKRWPDTRQSDALVSHVDLLPTLLDLAGAAAPDGMDGVSLRPELEGGRLDREELFAEYHSKQQWANPIRTVRTDRWKLNVYLDGGREIYDLAEDPQELRNLAGVPEQADIEAEMLGRLERWAERTDDRLWSRRK